MHLMLEAAHGYCRRTPVIIAVIANEPEKAILVSHTQDAMLFAPSSIKWEIGNAFSAMLKRRRITVEQATEALGAYVQIPLNFMEVDLIQAVELASHLDIYAYDAYIIACAVNRNCSLMSLDAGLVRAAKVIGLNVLEVT